MTEERFSDEEVSLILRRAIEAGADPGEPGGLTLGQLEEIAAEVGVDPARVRSAALSVRAEKAVGTGKGLRVTARYDVEVDGELSPEQWSDVLRVVRRVMGRQGIVSDERGEMGWRARDFFGGRYLTVRSRNGRTRIEALGNFRDGVMASVGFGLPAGLAVTAVTLKTLGIMGAAGALGFLGPVALVAGGALPGYALYRRWFRKEDATLRRTVAAIAAEVGGGATPETSERPTSEDADLPSTR